jgi:hypothetical protein
LLTELAARAVGAVEGELGWLPPVGVVDLVCLPAARGDTAHPWATGAAEHAHVAAGSPIGVHTIIIVRVGQERYYPNGGIIARPGDDSRGATGRCRAVCATLVVEARPKEIGVKGSQKPKSAAKKPAQKTLKERRSEKKAAAKIRGISE